VALLIKKENEDQTPKLKEFDSATGQEQQPPQEPRANDSAFYPSMKDVIPKAVNDNMKKNGGRRASFRRDDLFDSHKKVSQFDL